jgi:hypothetical protein
MVCLLDPTVTVRMLLGPARLHQGHSMVKVIEVFVIVVDYDELVYRICGNRD